MSNNATRSPAGPRYPSRSYDSYRPNHIRPRGPNAVSKIVHTSVAPRCDSDVPPPPSSPPPPPPPLEDDHLVTMDQISNHKRKASHSPEGGTVYRKASKPAPAGVGEGSSTPILRHGSRQSSILDLALNSAPEGPQQQQKVFTTAAGPSSPAPAFTSRLLSGRIPTYSPDSPGSHSVHYDDAISRRSTPQPPARRQLASKQALSGTAGQVLDLSDQLSITQVVEDINNHVTRHASFFMSRDMAYERYQNAKADLAKAQSLGPGASATADSLDRSKRKHKGEAERFDAKVEDAREAIKVLAQSLSHAISEVQPTKGLGTDQLDMISRAKYEKIQQEHDDFKSDTARQFEALRQEMIQAMSLQSASLQSRITKVENSTDMKDLQTHLEIRMDRQCGDLKTKVSLMENANARMEEDANAELRTTYKDLEQLRRRMSHMEDATRDLPKLFAKCDSLVLDHDNLLKKVDEVLQPNVKSVAAHYYAISNDVKVQYDSTTKLVQRVQKLEAERFSRSFNTLSPSEDPALTRQKMNEEVSVAIADLKQETAKIKDEIKALVAQTNGDEDEDYDAKVDLNSSHRKRLYHVDQKMTQLKGDIRLTRDEIRLLRDETHEQGKKPIVQRVKTHDQVINNIWSEITGIKKSPANESPLQPRLEKIETAHSVLERDVRSLLPLRNDDPIKGVSAEIDIPTSAAVTQEHIAALETRMISVEANVADLKEDQTEGNREVTTVVIAAVDNLKKEVAEQVDILDRRLTSGNTDLETFDKKLKQLHKQNAELQRSVFQIATSVMTQEMVDFRQRVTGENQERREAIAKLEASRTAAKEDVENLKIKVEIISGGLSALQEQFTTAAGAAPPASNGGLQQFQPLGRESPAVQSPWTSNLGSPQVNGQNHHGSYASPTINHIQGPSANPPAPFKILDQDVRNLKMQCNSLTGFVNQLKSRFDNLTTDELAQNMASQMSNMYPAARNFQKAIASLQAKDQSMQQRISELQSTATQAVDSLSVVGKDLCALQENVSSFKADLAPNMEKAFAARDQTRREIDNLAKQVNDIQGQVATALDVGLRDPEDTAAVQELGTRVDDLIKSQLELSQRLEKLSVSTADADTLKDHNYSIAKVQSDVVRVQKDVAKVSGRIDEIGKFQNAKVSDFTGRIDGVDKEFRELRDQINGVEVEAKNALAASKSEDPSDYVSETRQIADEAIAQIKELNEAKAQLRTAFEKQDELNRDQHGVNELQRGLNASNRDQFKEFLSYGTQLAKHKKLVGTHENRIQSLEKLGLQEKLVDLKFYQEELANLQEHVRIVEEELRRKGSLKLGGHSAQAGAKPNGAASGGSSRP